MSILHRFGFFDPTQEYSVTFGTLPHWEQVGATYFITYRTMDSIPRAAMELWKRENEEQNKRAMLRQASGSSTPETWEAQHQRFRMQARKLELRLDRLHGRCELRDPYLAKIVAENLLHFDGQRYDLGGFVVMPNHVHLIVCFHRGVRLTKQCYQWKHYTSRRINERLGTRGNFWQTESFDHLVRDGDHLIRFRQYMRDNGHQAGLADDEYLLYLPDIGLDDL